MGEATTATTRRTYGQACPVAYSLDLVGERWTLLVVRDLMFGPLRFTEIRDGLPGLSGNLLTERLRMLCERGIVEKLLRPTPGSRSMYALTPRGRELGPVIHSLARFGVPEWEDPASDPPPQRLLRGALLALMTPEALDDGAWTADLALGDTTIGLTVAGAAPAVAPLDRLRLFAGALPEPPDVVVISDLATLQAVRCGSLTQAEAESSGAVELSGEPGAVDQLRALLGLD